MGGNLRRRCRGVFGFEWTGEQVVERLVEAFGIVKGDGMWPGLLRRR